MEENQLIALKHINKEYCQGDVCVHALRDISLEVKKGEFVAVVGSSGSGKSTLMNLLGCLDLPDSGEYRLDGRDVSGLNDGELSEIRNRKIGFIFQGFNLIGNLTAYENVELPLIYRKMPKNIRHKLVTHALEKVSLGGRMNHRPGQMSGGQQQRVAIARALAAEPPMILADEPTGNLDSRSGKEVMRILHSMNAAGRTVILITHDDEIARQAKRLIRISDGAVAEDRYL